jgi:peptide methionine sulfoxide reductase MsrB
MQTTTIALVLFTATSHAYIVSSPLRMSQSASSSSSSSSSRRDFFGGATTTAAAAAAAVGAGVLAAPLPGLSSAAVAAGIPRTALGAESIMSPKTHGTTEKSVQGDLKFAVNNQLADRICSFNRRFAEPAGSYRGTTFEKEFLSAASEAKPLTFYDSVTGKPLFRAPVGRSPEEFLAESRVHGWPSFRDDEVVWENMRILRDGESVSVDGTHLGHNLPDGSGNRYCINLVSISGRPA